MIIQCTACRARFKIADERVPDKGAKVRCSRCSTIFFVRKNDGIATAMWPAANLLQVAQPLHTESQSWQLPATGVPSLPGAGVPRFSTRTGAGGFEPPGWSAPVTDPHGVHPYHSQEQQAPASGWPTQQGFQESSPHPGAPPGRTKTGFELGAEAVAQASAPWNTQTDPFSLIVTSPNNPAASSPRNTPPQRARAGQTQAVDPVGTLPAQRTETPAESAQSLSDALASLSNDLQEGQAANPLDHTGFVITRQTTAVGSAGAAQRQQTINPSRQTVARRGSISSAPAVSAAAVASAKQRRRAHEALHSTHRRPFAYALRCLTFAGVGLLLTYLSLDKMTVNAPRPALHARVQSTRLYETGTGRAVLFVQGEVENNTGRAARIDLEVQLKRGAQVSRSARSVAGTLPTAKEVFGISSPTAIDELLARQRSRAAPIPSGSVSPFGAIFYEFPEELSVANLAAVPTLAAD